MFNKRLFQKPGWAQKGGEVNDDSNGRRAWFEDAAMIPDAEPLEKAQPTQRAIKHISVHRVKRLGYVVVVCMCVWEGRRGERRRGEEGGGRVGGGCGGGRVCVW